MTLALRSTQLTVRSDGSGSLNKMVSDKKILLLTPAIQPHPPSPCTLDRDRYTSETAGWIIQRWSDVSWLAESHAKEGVFWPTPYEWSLNDGMNGVGKELATACNPDINEGLKRLLFSF